MRKTLVQLVNKKEFDMAVIFQALHLFCLIAGLKVLKKMKKVSPRIIIVDYAYPINARAYKWLTWRIEWLAGGDHYSNFKQYINNDGLDTILDESGFFEKEYYLQGKCTLMVSLCA